MLGKQCTWSRRVRLTGSAVRYLASNLDERVFYSIAGPHKDFERLSKPLSFSLYYVMDDANIEAL